jgi:Holliday junction DNA helicase RuvB
LEYKEEDFDLENRMVAPEYAPEDEETENPLRPPSPERLYWAGKK